jgi:SWI/SNF-related matrix-associated actin-dependent regulator 1 of chromatin subfamily A
VAAGAPRGEGEGVTADGSRAAAAAAPPAGASEAAWRAALAAAQARFEEAGLAGVHVALATRLGAAAWAAAAAQAEALAAAAATRAATAEAAGAAVNRRRATAQAAVGARVAVLGRRWRDAVDGGFQAGAAALELAHEAKRLRGLARTNGLDPGEEEGADGVAAGGAAPGAMALD